MPNILKVYNYAPGKSIELVPFPSMTEPLEIGEWTYNATRMGGAPTITAKVKYGKCLDNYWNANICVVFRGERYFIKDTPSSSKDNTDERYEYDITFKSERSVLDGIFFIDAVYNGSSSDLPDRYVSNNTNVVFMGDIHEFAGRLNSSLRYAGLGGLPDVDGYYVVVDAGITSEAKLMSFEDKYFSEVLQEIFNTYKLPYYFKGKEIHIGYTSNTLTKTFEYGIDNELLSIEKQNTNKGYTNRATGVGSSENLPFYYPNTVDRKASYPHFLAANSGETDDEKLSISNTVSFNSKMPLTTDDADVSTSDCLVYHEDTTAWGRDFRLYIKHPLEGYGSGRRVSNEVQPMSKIQPKYYYLFNLKNQTSHQVKYSSTPTVYKKTLDESKDKNINTELDNFLWAEFYTMQNGSNLVNVEISLWSEKKDGVVRYYSTPVLQSVEIFEQRGAEFIETTATAAPNHSKERGLTTDGSGYPVSHFCIECHNLEAYTTYYLQLVVHRNVNSDLEYDFNNNPDTCFWFRNWEILPADPHWSKIVEDRYEKATLSEYGIKLSDGSNLRNGDKIVRRMVESSGVAIPNATVLMPSIYRESNGTERFYNAKNTGWTADEKHLYQATDDGTMYRFENIYSVNDPRESKNVYDDIKPTIKGMVNADGKRMDVFLAVAFDLNNDDDFAVVDGETSADYNHPYFFVKLAKTTGRDDKYGFNLFDQACENGQEMTVSMTSGSCGGCNFTIMVDDNTGKNTVQADRAGVLQRDKDGRVLFGEPQEWQNDTRNNEVWICLKKEDSTYGQLMPNATQNLTPAAIDDTFVYTNIEMPFAYILDAEDRLSKAIVKDMWENNSEKFNFSIIFSRIFFAENPDIANQIDENTRIPIKYNGTTIYQYVSSFTYSVSKDVPLPEIKVELSEEISTNQNALQAALGEIRGDFMNALGSYDALRAVSPYFLRKDIRDTAAARIAFLQGVEIGNYVSGNFGTGGIFGLNADGSSFIEADFAYIRRKAIFTDLTIQELKHIGGQLVISPATAAITRVIDNGDSYRCFFNTTGGQTTAQIYNQFVVGDQARCQSFNEAWAGDEETVPYGQNRYYWRLVVGVGNGYVDLSKYDCDENSDIPQANDKISQLGNRTDVTRQNAQILSAYGTDAPSRKMFQGINSYSLEGKDVSSEFYNTETQRMKVVTYGDFYYGDREKNAFISWDTDKKQLAIKGRIEVTSTVGDTGKTLDKYIESVSPTYDDTSIRNLINGIQADLQKQIDGAIETWFFEGAPTLQNAPANGWVATETADNKETYDKHVGDLYYDKVTGFGYRFMKDGETYVWELLKDNDIVKALADAAKAQTTADSKMKVFAKQPTTSDEYNIGDLWVNATYGSQYSNDILRATTKKDKGVAFNISHWTLASNYTDDSALDAFKAEYEVLIQGFQEQLDGKVETWYFNYTPTTTNKPASDWDTAEKKQAHAGDLFFNTTTGEAYRWTGNAWSIIKDSDIIKALKDAANAQDTADGKRRVFMTQPTTPYDEGDLWVKDTADGKQLYVCIKSRATGNFDATEWVVSDDAGLNAFSDAVQNALKGIKDQLDQKAETWYQSTDPAAAWATPEERAEHKGDLWYDTNTGKTYYYDGSTWQFQNVPVDVFDKIDGKSSIYVSKPSSYRINDLWILEQAYTLTGVGYSKGELVTATATSSTFNANHWTKKVRYTDNTLALQAKQAADAAKAAADNAQADATAARNRLNAWAADGTISPTEKQSIKDEIARIDADKEQINAGYTKYGLGTPTGYNSSYNTYRAQLVALSAATPENIAIPATFANNQKTYYNNRTIALNNIASKAKDLADAAQAKADQAYTQATTALNNANTALSNANKAAQDLKNLITNLGDYVTAAAIDGVIDEQEALTLHGYLNQIKTIEEEVDASYAKVSGNTALAGTSYLLNLSKAYTNLMGSPNNAYDGAAGVLVRLIEDLLSNGQATGNISQIESAYNLFNSYYGDYTTALNAALLYVSEALLNPYKNFLENFAKKQSTTVDGGLILTTLIELGYIDANGVRKTMSGISGAGAPDVKGGGIASWYGGDMIDAEIKGNETKTNRARTLFRFDGSGYASDGQISWDKDGNVTLGTGVVIYTGNGQLNSTLNTILNFITKINTFLVPAKADGTELTWAEATKENTVAIKTKSVGFYSDTFVSALGLNPSGGTSSGGGLIETVYGYDNLGGSFNNSVLTDTFNAYTISRIAARVSSLENGSALNVNVTGNGNVLTNISKAGTTITATKGITALTAHQAVVNKAATLTWNTAVTVATVGATNITVKLPANPNTDTHWTTHLYAGSGTAANAATTNGNTKLAITDNSTVRNTVTFKGTGSTTVTSDASGVITINSLNTNTTNTAGSTDTSSKIFLIGATSQAANPQTYSHDTAFVGTDGCLYSGGAKVLTSHQSLANYYTKGEADGRYVNLTGAQTISGLKSFSGRVRIIGEAATPAWNVPCALTFAINTKDDQAVSLVYSDYDSYRAPAGLKLMGSQGNEWLEAPRFIKTGGTNSQFLMADGNVTEKTSLFTNFSLSNSQLTATIGGVSKTVETVLSKRSGGYTSMNDVAALGNCMGMTELSGTDTTINPNAQTGWHHFINLSYNYESTNMWQTQFAIKAGTTKVWVRSRAGGTVTNGTAWVAPWVQLARMTDIVWNNLSGKPNTIGGYGITDAYTKTDADNRYVNVSGDTMTGTLALKTGANHSGLRFNNNYITELGGNIIFQKLTAIRFGTSDAWNWDDWAGIKYDTAAKHLYIGFPDNTAFNHNGTASTGALTLAGVTHLDIPKGNKITLGGGTIEWDATNKGFKFTGGVYSTTYVSALGINPSGGSSSGGSGGLVESIYRWTDLGKSFSDANNDTFNAYTINKIRQDLLSADNELSRRIASLEGGSATSITTTGSGNAITAISKSGTVITATKGATFLTAHQPLDHINPTSCPQSLANASTSNTRVYYNSSGNSIADKPSGVDAFGMMTLKAAFGWTGQILVSSNTATGLYWRVANNSFNGGWRTVLDSANYTSFVKTYTLTLQKNGTTVGTYTPNSKAVTLNITDVASAATLSSHIGNTTMHITAAERTKWNNTSDTLSSNYVTLSTQQTISGQKFFSRPIRLSTQTATWLNGMNGASAIDFPTTGYNALAHWKTKNGHISISHYSDGGENLIFGYMTNSQVTNNSNSLNARIDFLMPTGTIQANSFKIINGAANQILMADGSIKALSDITSAYVTSLGINGNHLTWTKNGTTNNITVPYASNAENLDGLNSTSFIRTNGSSKYCSIGCKYVDDYIINGYKLVCGFSLGAWEVSRMVLAISSRHNCSGILNITLSSRDSASLDKGIYTDICFNGGTLETDATNWRAFYNKTTHVFRLYAYLYDHTNISINVLLRLGPIPLPSDGTFTKTLPNDVGDQLEIKYNIADALNTPRTINGTNFDGTANITTANWGTARNISIRDNANAHTGTAVSVNGSGNVTLILPATISATLSGNASTATALQTARTIWGQSFNGTGNVSGNMTGVGSINMSGQLTLNNKMLVRMNNDATLKIYPITSHVNSSWGPETVGIQTCFDNTDGETSNYVTLYNNRCVLALQPRGGSVGIGTSAPSSKLHVNGDSFLVGNVKTNNAFSTINGLVYAELYNDCWTDDLGYKHYWYGIDFKPNKENTAVRTILSGAGGLLLHGWNAMLEMSNYVHSNVGIYSDSFVSAMGLNSSSDIRLKNILNDVNLPLYTIANAPSVVFKWKKNDEKAVGSIAQYWQNILPEAVHEHEGYLEMQYDVIALLSAISIAKRAQDHERRIKILEEENVRLKEEIYKLKTV